MHSARASPLIRMWVRVLGTLICPSLVMNRGGAVQAVLEEPVGTIPDTTASAVYVGTQTMRPSSGTALLARCASLAHTPSIPWDLTVIGPSSPNDCLGGLPGVDTLGRDVFVPEPSPQKAYPARNWAKKLKPGLVPGKRPHQVVGPDHQPILHPRHLLLLHLMTLMTTVMVVMMGTVQVLEDAVLTGHNASAGPGGTPERGKAL